MLFSKRLRENIIFLPDFYFVVTHLAILINLPSASWCIVNDADTHDEIFGVVIRHLDIEIPPYSFPTSLVISSI
jgi:hypothetical protein